MMKKLFAAALVLFAAVASDTEAATCGGLDAGDTTEISATCYVMCENARLRCQCDARNLQEDDACWGSFFGCSAICIVLPEV